MVRYNKTLTKHFCSSIRIGNKVTAFKYKPAKIIQSFCVDTKGLMIKRYEPVEEAQITDPGFMVPTP